MRKLFTGIAIAMLSAGSAQAYVINFNSFGSGTTYSEGGATITAAGQTFSGVNSPNGTNAILSQGSPRAEFTANFAGTTGFVSVDLGDFNADSDLLFLEAFDSANNLLGSTSLLIGSSDVTMHTLSVTFAGIASARFGGRAPALNGNSIFADNLTFDAAVVPEPSAWALLILGFGMVGGLMRRRSTALRYA